MSLKVLPDLNLNPICEKKILSKPVRLRKWTKYSHTYITQL